MTKKDFQLIASVIDSLSVDLADTASEYKAMKLHMAEKFANALATTNPAFKRDLFIQAATGVVPVTARKSLPPLCVTCGGDCKGSGHSPEAR